MNIQFHDFELEYYQSQFERIVDYNLADSSVQCVNIRDLLSENETEQLLDTALFYPEVNGTRALRDQIAALYPGAANHNVLVTVGAAQANSLICSTLLEPGDQVIVISPGYRQVWGLAKNLGCRVKELQLRPEDAWRPDLDKLESLAGSKTKLIAIVNPNNPTGSILSPDEMREIVRICEKTGAWLHADEVYRGTEINQDETPTFWGQYGKTICTNSLSKAYGLAGLRIGWAIAAPETIEALWRRHEYAVIAASGPSMKLAEIALRENKRRMLLERQKKLSKEGHFLLERWIQEQNGIFSMNKAAATSIGFVQYHFDMSSVELAKHLRKQASVLVAPGSYLGTENHLRMAVGYQPEKLKAALSRISKAVAELEKTNQSLTSHR
jgi:aspartate/methionine/tyrosine aminotransferase